MMSARAQAIALAAVIVISAGQRPAGQTAAPTKPAPTTPVPAVQAPTREAIVAAARTTIAKAGFATLSTVDAKGQPQARIVDPFAPEGDFTVWVATNARSRKVTEIGRNPRVSLLYFDTAGRGYVTLIGTATLVRDPAEKARHWKEEWAAFYKDENRGDDYLLIRVVPTRLEISAPALGMNNDPVTWAPVTITLRR